MLSGRTGWRGTGPGKPAARSCRPGLEQLENRLAPAVYRVTTFQDTPAVNLATGMDAAGQISLRSAVSAANRNAQPDTILLNTGTYHAEHGGLQVQGNLQIIGHGPGQTVIEAGHLDRLFEVAEGGDLQLNGLTLDGVASTLLKGPVHLANTQFDDQDLGVLVAALLVSRKAEPVVALPVAILPAPSGQAPEVKAAAPLLPIHLVGLAGGGVSRAQTEETPSDIHQTFWRIDNDASPQPASPAPKGTDEKQPGPATEPGAAIQPEHMSALGAAEDIRIVTIMATASYSEKCAALRLLPLVRDLEMARVVEGNDAEQAVVLFLLLGCRCHRQSAKATSAGDAKAGQTRRWRRRTAQRFRGTPEERKRTRGPPGHAWPPTTVEMKIRQGRQ